MRGARTRFKLAEAQFFMAQVEAGWRHVPDVEFYLSAFVSAARSVTWVMRHEFGAVPGWSDWFESEKPSPEIRDLLRRMNSLRVRSTKTIPLKARTTANLEISPHDVTPELMSFLVSGAKGAMRLEPLDHTDTEFMVKVEGTPLAKARLKSALHELPEFKGQDARVACSTYLAELQRLVAECQSRFGEPNEKPPARGA